MFNWEYPHPQQELLNTFSLVMGGGACARILECRFLAPYFPFIVLKMFEQICVLLQYQQNSLSSPYIRCLCVCWRTVDSSFTCWWELKDISSYGLFAFFISFKMKGEGLKLISKVYVYGSNCEFKWSGKYMKMLSLFVHVSVGDILGLVCMEKC